MKSLITALLLAMTLAGCGGAARPVGQASTPSAPAVDGRVIEGYKLYTHCGIREAKIGKAFYLAVPELSDGNGNPPADWDNPFQVGTMTVHRNGTARFVASGGLEATFSIRPGATTWSMLCA